MAEPGPANPTSPRPQQVTYAGWGVVLGSVALVISAFQQISTLHSLDTRTTVERLVADQPSGLTITVDTWLEVLKVLGMVSGACAAAAAILGWQALQRSRSARIALLVIGVPLVLAGLASGPIFALLVGFGVVVLWLPSANAWFDPAAPGKMQAMSDAPRPPASPTPSGSAGPVQPAAPVPPPIPAPPAGPYGQQPPPPFGQPPYGAAPAPPPQPGTWPPNPHAQQPQQPYPPYAPQGGRPGEVGPRPGPVTAAVIITIVLSGVTAILGVILAVVGAAVSDDLLSDLADRGYDITNVTSHELAVGLAVIGGFVVVVALAAIVVAIFVLRRSRGARVVLTVFSALTILTSLITITSVVAVLPLAGAIATIVLLYQRSSSDWFAGGGARPPAPPVYPGGSWPGA
ncbi:hypothetical protein [Nocardioides sp. Iso805N]|uniref:hypothetical protein n=1 Tax=Nocardioides sp. Iso805N TaxID=1283287 RepID=UPI0003A078C3|nr:hypothetical protein [Nocardioides sp. Iso805N]